MARPEDADLEISLVININESIPHMCPLSAWFLYELWVVGASDNCLGRGLQLPAWAQGIRDAFCLTMP